MRIKPFVMKPALMLPVVFVILLCVALSGCTTLPGTGTPATPVATRAPTPEPVTIASPLTTPTSERLQILPREREVNLMLTKDRPTSEIHLQYQGGPGEIFVTAILMRVYTTDSVFREYVMSNGKKPQKGDEIVAPGTRGKDRCEVFVISSGTRYKVLDEPVTGGGYY